MILLTNINKGFNPPYRVNLNVNGVTIWAKYYSSSNFPSSFSSSMMKKNYFIKKYSTTRNLDDPAKDFSLLQKFGFDPRYILIHKEISGKPVSWSYGSMDYVSLGCIHDIQPKDIFDFMSEYIKDHGVTYAVLPVLVDPDESTNREYTALSGQIILTNLVNPQELYNHIEICVKIVSARYGFDISGELIFRLRVISYDNVVYNKVLNIPKDNVVKDHVPLKMLEFNDTSLPLTTDLNQYGGTVNNEYVVNGSKMEGTHYLYKDNIIIFVHKSDKIGVRKLTVFKNNVKYYECIDNFDDQSNVFRRDFANDFSLFIDKENNKVLYTENTIKCKPLRKGKIDLRKDDKISSFDIECYLDNTACFQAFACGFATPENKVKLYYLTDYKDINDLIKSCMIDMLNSDLGTVYVHNLSRFDIFFMNSILKEDDDIFGEYRLNNHGKIMNITVKFKDRNKKGKFVFKDSILMLQGSLRNVTSSFKTDTAKGHFPYKFPNESNLDYIGDKPSYDYFTDISLDEYNKIPCKNWNMKNECLKYLSSDLLGLQEAIKKFSSDIYKLEKLNITNLPTISTLAFKSITTNYIEPDTLYQVKGRAHEYMRRGYFGGVSEVYTLSADESVKIYDINSSYPASMKQTMPIGQPVFTTQPGLDNYFGVVFAEIETPKDRNGNFIKLDHPPLPFRLDDGSIINPVGKWKGVYCSELLKYVRDVWNYNVRVNYGYKFNKGYGIFDEYVDKYYKIKSGKSDITGINKSTSKLMINSGYGKTGTKIDDTITEFTTSDKSAHIQSKYDVISLIQYTPNFDWIKYRRKINYCYSEPENSTSDEITQSHEKSKNYKNLNAARLQDNDSHYDVEQCLPIAIFTTAYSCIRLFEAIRKIKELGGTIYAVDTDSVHTNVDLPADWIGDELGQWKLEFEGIKGYYPLPKVYMVEGYKVDKGKVDDKLTEIKKGKGLSKDSLTKDEYIKLTKGEEITKNEERFSNNKRDSNVKLKNTSITLKGLVNKRKVKNILSTEPLLVIDNILEK